MKTTIKAGDNFTNNAGLTATVIKYLNAKEIIIRFDKSQSITSAQSSGLKRGQFKDKLSATVSGVGIKGEVATHSNGIPNLSYVVWKDMLKRCYATNEKTRQKHNSYDDVTVCDSWLFYPNFKAWFDNNYVEGFQLDKDIYQYGNKQYSPSSCVFVPSYINCLVLGVNSRGYSLTIDDGYETKLRIGGRQYTKLFKDAESAHLHYCLLKLTHIERLAIHAYDRGHINKKALSGLLRIKVNGYSIDEVKAHALLEPNKPWTDLTNYTKRFYEFVISPELTKKVKANAS